MQRIYGDVKTFMKQISKGKALLVHPTNSRTCSRPPRDWFESGFSPSFHILHPFSTHKCDPRIRALRELEKVFLESRDHTDWSSFGTVHPPNRTNRLLHGLSYLLMLSLFKRRAVRVVLEVLVLLGRLLLHLLDIKCHFVR